MHTCADHISNRPGYLVPTREHISRSHAPAWECIPALTISISFPRSCVGMHTCADRISFPGPCVGMHTMVYLVPTLLRGNAYLSRSHAPAWECIPTLSRSHAPAWECIQWSISFPRPCVGMHTCALSFPRSSVGMHTYADRISRSHAPAWECIPALTVSRSQAPRGNAYLR